jgi:hypothetical protein
MLIEYFLWQFSNFSVGKKIPSNNYTRDSLENSFLETLILSFIHLFFYFYSSNTVLGAEETESKVFYPNGAYKKENGENKK